MSIKEQIEKWAHAPQLLLALLEHKPEETAADLKALAASHTELLEVLKEAVNDLDEYAADTWLKAQPIIKEAEKLSGNQAFEHVTNGDPCPCEPRIEKIEVEKL